MKRGNFSWAFLPSHCLRIVPSPSFPLLYQFLSDDNASLPTVIRNHTQFLNNALMAVLDFRLLFINARQLTYTLTFPNFPSNFAVTACPFMSITYGFGPSATSTTGYV